ncbi:tripartite tricarboxylate transporter TctB family protein [Thalassobacter stenotrophicus]|uniref:Tripartite tricarboxylate transporter TctB family protein n=2 Tax=Thalassobacter stenotrophicus TaxID=266809 RepID=A0A0P1FGF0_9RHOB|nr:tripartite tricarboxylate transporter TctB family protein [Thalassobacter stenotrophicus]PVZ47372.1 tripartite tricarboxylate transporter TctB family protein [Thalassobacter stenotrophicus]CUH60047.1 Tripartite tricarboxylate transporter TctB family protein [Thalassobacter stenotrophicus]SHJ21524.1 Tripartite tricarboxylate transporter TctB family protein [Thalassobacter stenotrophicus DSM 16310]
MSKHALDFAFAMLLCVACIFLWFVADGFRGSPRYAQIDTDFWPKIVTGVAAVLTGIIAAQNAYAWWQERRLSQVGETITIDWARIGRMAAMGGLVLLYFFTFDRVGFLLATVAFLWVAAFSLHGGRIMTKIIFAPVFTIALTALFTKVLGLPVPRGDGVFYQFSLMFY